MLPKHAFYETYRFTAAPPARDVAAARRLLLTDASVGAKQDTSVQHIKIQIDTPTLRNGSRQVGSISMVKGLATSTGEGKLLFGRRLAAAMQTGTPTEIPRLNRVSVSQKKMRHSAQGAEVVPKVLRGVFSEIAVPPTIEELEYSNLRAGDGSGLRREKMKKALNFLAKWGNYLKELVRGSHSVSPQMKHSLPQSGPIPTLSLAAALSLGSSVSPTASTDSPEKSYVPLPNPFQDPMTKTRSLSSSELEESKMGSRAKRASTVSVTAFLQVRQHCGPSEAKLAGRVSDPRSVLLPGAVTEARKQKKRRRTVAEAGTELTFAEKMEQLAYGQLLK